MSKELQEGIDITKKEKSKILPTLTRKEKKQLVSLKDEVTRLKEGLEEKTRQADEFISHLQRLQAEFENYKKNAEKEKAEFVKYAGERLVKDLLDVYENLERAIENGKKSDNKKALLEGVEMTYKQMEETLEKEGLEPIEAVGEKFDPFKHEVLLSEVREDLEDGTILEEIRRGYTLNKKVIKYSKVKISKKK